jgi:hypothetical protein
MRAFCPLSAFRARAAFTCFAAVFFFNFNLPSRSLPSDWGWTQIWPPFPLQTSAYAYSGSDTGYYRTPDFLFSTSDGLHWTFVEHPTSADADPGRTRYFQIVDRKTVASYDPLDLTFEEAEFLIPDLFSAVHFGDYWWTVRTPSYTTLQSADGQHWEVSPLQPAKPDAVLDRYRMVGAALLTDGNYLYLVSSYRIDITGPSTASDPIENPTYDVILKRDLAGGVNSVIRYGPNLVLDPGRSPQLIAIDGQPMRVKNLPKMFEDYPAELSCLLNSGTLIVSDRSASVVIRKIDEPPSRDLTRVSLPASVEALASNGTSAALVDGLGTVHLSHDGVNWAAVASLPPNGFLAVEIDGSFIYVLPGSIYTSQDGGEWAELPLELPDPAAKLVLRERGYLAMADRDQTGLPDTIWLRSSSGVWELLEENLPFTSAHYLAEIDLTMIVTDTPRQTIVHTGRQRMVVDDFLIPVEPIFESAEESDSSPPWQSTKPTDIAYGNGFILSASASQTLDDRLTIASDVNSPREPWMTHSTNLTKSGSRFLLSADGTVYLSDLVPPYPFSDGFLKGNGWRGSPWFGWVNTKDYPWVFHYPAGWIYTLGPDENSCWMWDDTEGWFWTNQYYWPTIWSKDKGWRAHKRMKAEG